MSLPSIPSPAYLLECVKYARRRSHGLASELRVLILHGMIHLAGFDHEKDSGEMMQIERRLRRRLGLR